MREIVIIAIAIITGNFAGGAYRRYRNKKRSERHDD